MALGWLWWRAWARLVASDATVFAWQAWHLVTSTFVLRGRRGTWGTGLALVARWVARGAVPLGVAGMALGDIHLRFAWQAWHLVTLTFHVRGKRGTCGTELAVWHFVTYHLSL